MSRLLRASLVSLLISFASFQASAELKVGTITGLKGIPLSYAYQLHPDDERPTLLILNGRADTWLRYLPLMQHFYESGYNVFTYDHRGQGLSGRMLSDPTKGYVADFNNYVVDLHRIYQEVIQPRQQGPLLALAHSMGGAIVSLYLEQYPDVFDAAALTSPMIDFNPGHNLAMTCAYARTVRWLTNLVGMESPYMPSQEPWHIETFDENRVTHSLKRFDAYEQLRIELPKIRLGGVTVGWVAAACDGVEPLKANTNKIEVRVLMLQAGQDRVVSIPAQNRFCKKKNANGMAVCIGGKPVVFENALHEIIFESDAIYDKALFSIDNYLKDAVADKNQMPQSAPNEQFSSKP